MRVFVSLLLFCYVCTSRSYAEEITFESLKSLKECPASNNVTTRFQTFLKKTYDKVKAEKRVYSWEMEDRSSRTPHYCIDECACLSGEYAKALNTCEGVEVFGLRLIGAAGTGVLPVELSHYSYDTGKKVSYNHSYQYHVATLIHFMNSECYAITDPIMDREELLSPSTWVDHVLSSKQNKLFRWKIEKTE